MFDIDTHEQYVTITPFGGQGNRLVYTPKRVLIEGKDGAVLDARDNPEDAYAGQTAETHWDQFHAAFFAGEALWTCRSTSGL